jgi:hypothetical protein
MSRTLVVRPSVSVSHDSMVYRDVGVVYLLLLLRLPPSVSRDPNYLYPRVWGLLLRGPFSSAIGVLSIRARARVCAH